MAEEQLPADQVSSLEDCGHVGVVPALDQLVAASVAVAVALVAIVVVLTGHVTSSGASLSLVRPLVTAATILYPLARLASSWARRLHALAEAHSLLSVAMSEAPDSRNPNHRMLRKRAEMLADALCASGDCVLAGQIRTRWDLGA